MRNLPGMRGVKYRIDDGMQQVYYVDSGTGKDAIIFEVEEGVDINQDIVNVARRRATQKDGELYGISLQNAYSGKKKSNSSNESNSSTGGSAR
jgi:hypothetical protein